MGGPALEMLGERRQVAARSAVKTWISVLRSASSLLLCHPTLEGRTTANLSQLGTEPSVIKHFAQTCQSQAMLKAFSCKDVRLRRTFLSCLHVGAAFGP